MQIKHWPMALAALFAGLAQMPSNAQTAPPAAPPMSQQAQNELNSILAASPPFTGDAALGCKILLCLANPNVPEAVSECIQPIQTLLNILNENPPGQPPTCPMASTPGNRNYAVPTTNYYTACPAGMTALAAGAQAALQGQPVIASWTNSREDGPQETLSGVYTGIGNGEGLYPSYSRENGYTPLQPMTCVGQQVGTITPKMQGAYAWWESASSQAAIPVYNQIQIIQPGGHGRAMDVYINNNLHNVVHLHDLVPY